MLVEGRRTIATHPRVRHGHRASRVSRSFRLVGYAPTVNPPPHHAARLVWPLALLLLCTVATPDARSRPLRVRGHSGLTMRVERTAEGLHLRGILSGDDETALAGQAVHVAVEGLAGRTFLTDGEGRFELLVGAADARHLAESLGEQVAVSLSYEGDATWGPAEQADALDLRREPTWVQLQLDPPRVGLDEAQVAIRAAVSGASGPVGNAPLRLQVGDGPELVGDSDDSGQVTFLVRPDAIDRAGAFEVRASYPGDHRFAPSEARQTLQILRPTRITLRVGREGDERSGRYRFSGRLADDRGGVAGATIAIVVQAEGDSPTSETVAVTDRDGVYLVALDVRELASRVHGVVEVTARYVPQDGLRRAAESRPARIPVPSPPGVPLQWYGLALAIAAANLLLVGAVRQRLREWWRAISERFRRRVPVEAQVIAEPALVLAAGTGKDRRLDWVAASIVDAHTGRRVVGATMVAVLGDAPERRAEPSGSGFALGPLAPGNWTLLLAAPGYMSRESRLRVPHDGSFDGAVLAMVSVRGRVRDIFVGAMASLDRAVRWGRDTPAEVTRTLSADPAAEALRTVVEEAWFGPGAPEPDVARRAEALAKSMGESP
ncbi:MAG: hypothetical protein R3F39_22630 [Myxococcota bacterium]